jgi:hypothetical protein
LTWFFYDLSPAPFHRSYAIAVAQLVGIALGAVQMMLFIVFGVPVGTFTATGSSGSRSISISSGISFSDVNNSRSRRSLQDLEAAGAAGASNTRLYGAIASSN